MIRETWAFWILLLALIGQVIQIFCYANGMKRKMTWDADLSSRLTSIIVCVIFGFIYAIALGWI